MTLNCKDPFNQSYSSPEVWLLGLYSACFWQHQCLLWLILNTSYNEWEVWVLDQGRTNPRTSPPGQQRGGVQLGLRLDGRIRLQPSSSLWPQKPGLSTAGALAPAGFSWRGGFVLSEKPPATFYLLALPSSSGRECCKLCLAEGFA